MLFQHRDVHLTSPTVMNFRHRAIPPASIVASFERRVSQCKKMTMQFEAQVALSLSMSARAANLSAEIKVRRKCSMTFGMSKKYWLTRKRVQPLTYAFAVISLRLRGRSQTGHTAPRHRDGCRANYWSE